MTGLLEAPLAETADASTDGVTGLDAGGEVSNKFAISDVCSGLEIDE